MFLLHFGKGDKYVFPTCAVDGCSVGIGVERNDSGDYTIGKSVPFDPNAIEEENMLLHLTFTNAASIDVWIQSLIYIKMYLEQKHFDEVTAE